MYVTTKRSDTERSLAVEKILEDIPGGGVVSTYDFPSTTTGMKEGAPLGVSSDGIYHIMKTAMLANPLTATSSNHIIVYNNHEFVAGDYIGSSTSAAASGVLIASIAASGAGKDVIAYATGASGMCVAIAVSGCVVQASGLGHSPFKFTLAGIATNSVDLAASGNNGCAIVVRGRVRKSLMPYHIDTAIEALLPLIRFV